MKVLCVDDSKIMRRIIAGAVAVLGYDLIEAKSGRQALDLLAEHHGDVSLVTLDIYMPEMDGLETLRNIRQDQRFGQVPVIMITSEGSQGSIAEAIRAGANHYIHKPFTPEDLASRMLETLGLAY